MKRGFSIPGFENIDPGSSVPTGGLTTGQKAIQVFIELTLIISILLALYFIIKGGIDIITSQGDKQRIKDGRGRILFAVMGLIFLFLSFFIISVIGTVINVDLLCIVFKNPSSCL